MIPLTLIQVIFILLMGFAMEAKPSLHSKLHHFEILTLSRMKVRVKRSSSSGKLTSKYVSFFAMGQNFKLDLKPGSPVVDPEDFEAKGVDANGNTEKVDVDFDAFYVGTMNGNQKTVVDASYVDGVWSAQIQAPDDHYFIEPLKNHDVFGHKDAMVMYRNKDVKTQNMSSSNEDSLNSSLKTVSFETDNNNTFRTENWSRFGDRLPSWDDNYIRTRGQKRKYRLPRNAAFPYLYCDMMAIVDTYAFRGFGNSSLHKTASKIIYWYQLSNRIFSTTDFGNFYGIGIRLRAMKILTQFSNGHGRTHYNMESKDGFPNLEGVLFAMARETEFSQYCLSHLTTQRSTEEPVLGISIIGNDPHGDVIPNYRSFWSGGICAADYGQSNNVGVSTATRTDEAPMDAVYLVILTHEIGHSWGARHDTNLISECSPSVENGGKFIMDPRVNSAKNRNNFKFSPCSRMLIDHILMAKAHKCFYPAKSVRNFCGNGLLEPDEECDEGISPTNSCCTDRCRLRDGAVCSETSSPCCTKECKAAPPTQPCFNIDRRHCHEQAYCNGIDATSCPQPKPRPNGEMCVGHGTCWHGRCLSYCENKARLSEPPMQLVDCACEGDIQLCMLCCREQGTHECKPMFRDSFPDGVSCLYGTCQSGKCTGNLRIDIYLKHIRLQRLRDLEKQFWLKYLVFFVTAIISPIYIVSEYLIYRLNLKLVEEKKPEEVE